MTLPLAQATPLTHVGPAPRSLPAWFTANRVHGHTRLAVGQWQGTDESKWLLPVLGRLAPGFTRNVNTRDEDPGWPMGLPPQRNVVATLIHEAHIEGLKIFTYYWHMSEKTLEERHRNWVCRRGNGTPIRAARRGNFWT